MSNYFSINAIELSQEEVNMIEGGTFCMLGSLFSAPTYCAPKVSFCAPKISLCAPKVSSCEPKVSYCTPTPAVKPAASTPVVAPQP